MWFRFQRCVTTTKTYLSGISVAIVGRANVGKSTLFNRICGKKMSIVHDEPGVTRDWREAYGNLGGTQVRVVDTAGMDLENRSEMNQSALRITLESIRNVDLCLMVYDARVGITSLDEEVARSLRQQANNVPMILVANKCENIKASADGIAQGCELGLGDPVAISAEAGDGLSDLSLLLTPLDDFHSLRHDRPFLKPSRSRRTAKGEDDPDDDEIRAVIVGQPNVGKSTLINSLLGYERCVTGPKPGVTRDSVSEVLVHDQKNMRIFDTSGIRRPITETDDVDRMASEESDRALRYANTVVLVTSAPEAPTHYDLTIANRVIDQGRGLVMVINKSDLINTEENPQARQAYMNRVRHALPQVKGIPLVMTTATKGKNTKKVLDRILEVHQGWNGRISTAKLNRWLKEIARARPHPTTADGRVVLKYMTQVNSRPPTFALFYRANEISESYVSFLRNNLYEEFSELAGVPLRLIPRKLPPRKKKSERVQKTHSSGKPMRIGGALSKHKRPRKGW